MLPLRLCDTADLQPGNAERKFRLEKEAVGPATFCGVYGEREKIRREEKGREWETS